jgi:N-acetyl-alpha-D-glucosaminyl L-malate synthase BshA
VFHRIRQRIRARFILVGDGPVRPDVERQIAQLGLTDDISFAGEQQELVPLLSVGDLFLLPSAKESFGLAALEAMACGVPVVASNVGGLPEIIEDGVTGFVCPPDAIDLMAARSIEILTNPARRASIAETAASLVHTRYCTDAIVPLYEEQYQRVLETR